MIARRLIDNASVEPEVYNTINEAFDAAWAEIALDIGNDPLNVGAARLKLAATLLTVAAQGSRDVEVLKEAALRRMQLHHWK